MQTQSKVRLAQPSDEPEILTLCRLMHKEMGRRRLDIDKVRSMLGRAFNKTGGILSVIGTPGSIRAMQFLLISQEWYTDEPHLEELFNWVHPDHRNSDYAKLLIENAKKCSDRLSGEAGFKIPLWMGIMTNKRMYAKVRLYRRSFGLPYGAVFLHNATWVTTDDVCEEDIFRVPSIAKMIFKKEEREHRKSVKSKAAA